ncbi:SpoIIE family protein phosphatase [Streptomyces polygonati]|uniref:histidine kinase n=1 Tax=Streptomyces polygonati TaxID=1617087 RepID=A0ABV8HGQ3_9ACTN
MVGREQDRAELLFPGDGEMARRMRAYPWADSPMGEPESWPAGLHTAIRICLTSRFPMIVWWGAELRFLYNDAYLPLLGTNHPALAKPGDQVWREIWHIIGPMLRSVMDTGRATWSEDLLLPLVRHGYLEETYWTYSYSPLHDDDGAVRGVFTAVSDTTERVIGERRLAALRDLGSQAGSARSVTEACQLVAAALDRAGADVPFAEIHLRAADGGGPEPAASTSGSFARPLPDGDGGWPLAEVLGGGGPVTLSDVRERFGELPSGGGWQAPPRQAVVLPLPGETGARDVGVIVLAASAGRMLDDGYLSFLNLVAQQTAALVNGAVAYQVQQRRAEELAELDRAKTAFFSNISHEFRTPLTLIMGPVRELLDHADGLDAPVREELEVVNRNGLRLGRLVNALLDFSRIEAGRTQARYEPVNLSLLTAELAGVFRSAVEKAGLDFDVRTPELPQPVHLDRQMWEKVMLNLLSNALKFTFEGRIGVSVAAEDGRAVVRVSDTGIGVAREEMPRLFERFHRVRSARARSDEGSGIGLALVRELVELHGGTITADSAEGAGTTFTVSLAFGDAHLPAANVAPPTAVPTGSRGVSTAAEPFVQEALRWLPDIGDPAAAEERLPEQAGAEAAGGPGPARVLIADDNADMREYLGRLLRSRYTVDAVGDGRSALDAARADPPDLVVSDVMMPGMDGLELVAALRADPRTAGVPVLLLSARAGQEASVEGLEAGADDYLVKPFAAGELMARVRANVQLARLRNHHARWRTALIDSLQEGFFLCDEDGAVLEINTAFAEVLGYGPEALPYRPPHPWWPAAGDPAAREVTAAAFTSALTGPSGNCVVPVEHRDGRRLWAAVAYNEVRDPESGRRMYVGTLRDVSAERLAVQREAALAALSLRLARVGSVSDALNEALEEFRSLWRSPRALAVTWGPEDGAAGHPRLTGTTAGWAELPEPLRATLLALRDRQPLTAVPTDDGVKGAGITLEHPEGRLTIWLEIAPPRPFGPEDHTLLALLCGTLGPALHRAHLFDQQRETSVALQRAILGPGRLPAGFAARYEPAGRPLEVGGDWYDSVELPDGRIAIVVGDCVGRGLHAAAVMGQLRSACRALLIQSMGPASALEALDRFAALVPGAHCATVFCGILDPADGELTYSSAGHPPGILVGAEGDVRLLEEGRSLPLAVRPGRPRPEARCTVPPRATLLLYTDGLVERRRLPLDDGIARAGAAIRAGRTVAVEELASEVLSRMAPAGGYDDDVALLVYRHPGPLELAFPAESGQLSTVRGALRGWLATCGLSPRQAQDVLVAAGEACANAVEHGRRAGPGGRVRLLASTTADTLRLTVTDNGSWRTPRATPGVDRGRGIALMRALVHQVVITPGPEGTTVDFHTRIAP